MHGSGDGTGGGRGRYSMFLWQARMKKCGVDVQGMIR